MSLHYCARMLALALILGLSACGSEATRYYLLSSNLPRPELSAEPGKRVGIWKVRMPDYLERGEIVRRRGSDQLGLSSLDRWGEPLSENVSSILARNMSALCPSLYVTVLPAPATPHVDLEVRTRVLAFERSGDKAGLDAEIGVEGKSGQSQSYFNLHSEHQCSGQEVAATVECMNAALLDFSRQLASRPELNCPK